MIETVFWLLLGTIAFVYAGYPLFLLLCRAVIGARRVEKAAIEPAVTVIISAYNEASVIEEKIRNTLSLDYPFDRLEVILVSDASTDATDEIAQRTPDARLRVLRMRQRGGKTLGLNAALKVATGDIIVFTDANAMFETGALRALIGNFSDPRVGGVVGESGYGKSEHDSDREESRYWAYEIRLKELESALGSVVGGDGAIYAIRRELYRDLDADALSDFVNPMQIVRAGYRFVFEPAARCYEDAAKSFSKEANRKVRIVNRAWRSSMKLLDLLNPARYGLFALQFLTHKMLRWLLPFAFAVLLLASIPLAASGEPLYVLALIAQVAFYAAAGLGWLLRARPALPAMLRIPMYFCMVNIASARGIIESLMGRTYATWATVRAPGRSQEAS